MITLGPDEGILCQGGCEHQGQSTDDSFDTNNIALNMMPLDWLRLGPLSIAMNLEPLIAAFYPSGAQVHLDELVETYFAGLDALSKGAGSSHIMYEALNNVSPHGVMCIMLRRNARQLKEASEAHRARRARPVNDKLAFDQRMIDDAPIILAMIAYARAALHAARPMYLQYMNPHGDGGTLCNCAASFSGQRAMDELIDARMVSCNTRRKRADQRAYTCV